MDCPDYTLNELFRNAGMSVDGLGRLIEQKWYQTTHFDPEEAIQKAHKFEMQSATVAYLTSQVKQLTAALQVQNEQ
ncbi:MAG: hypothetical protein ACK443_05870 [Methylococcaceae bacterium]